MQPFHDLAAQVRSIRDELDGALERVLASGRYILGSEGERFEEELAAWLGIPHVVGVASGMAALELGLRALGIGPGDEVIVPALTAVPTAMAVVAVGATPRLADVDLATFTLDPASLEREITPAAKAVVPVHLYGQCADLAAIGSLAAQHGLALIEDAAQAHGAADGGRRAGTVGRLGCFSFYPTKNLGALGDAGAVATRDDALAERLRALRNYGNRGGFRFAEPGLNERLDEVQAAVLRVKLGHLDGWNERRRAHAARYREQLAGTSLALPAERAGAHHVYHQFVVRSPSRDALRERLARDGVETAIHYPQALHEVEGLAARVRYRERPRRAEEAARSVLSLPIYPELPREHLERTITALRAVS
ncbi:MAG TPA: DegT/DnrJ/EryC1/StrS family aminotransferase [Myxococcota bacterium]|nr:DegT/DnrJ/EryC1/StrS family aminotransferase [Myxococcota bacterium]